MRLSVVPTKEFVLYSYDVKTQRIVFLCRDTKIPSEYREYEKLWRVTDKQRQIQTIIINL